MRTEMQQPLALTGLLTLASCDSEKAATSIFPALDKVIQLNKMPYGLAEGPSWDGENTLYFSEILKNRIHRVDLLDKQFELFLDNTATVNGMTFDSAGQLWMCEQATGSIARIGIDPKSSWVVAGEFQGKPFNHPNDLSLDAYGGVYFTDPSWNNPDFKKQPVNGVYYVNADGVVSLLVEDMHQPNGILLSADGNRLYIADMATGELRVYTVSEPGKLSNGRQFTQLNTEGVENAAPDGLEEDAQGNLYVAAENGIQVYNPAGQLLDRLALEQRPTNLEFVNQNKTLLVATTRNNLYLVPLTMDFSSKT